MVTDVLAKLDKARELTAQIQADYRATRIQTVKAWRNTATSNFRIAHPKGAAKTSRIRQKAKRNLPPTRRQTNRFIEFLFATQTHCPYCLALLSSPSIDHITPLAKGGTHHPNNLILACKPCNSRKGARHWPPPHHFNNTPLQSLNVFT